MTMRTYPAMFDLQFGILETELQLAAQLDGSKLLLLPGHGARSSRSALWPCPPTPFSSLGRLRWVVEISISQTCEDQRVAPGYTR